MSNVIMRSLTSGRSLTIRMQNSSFSRLPIGEIVCFLNDRYTDRLASYTGVANDLSGDS